MRTRPALILMLLLAGCADDTPTAPQALTPTTTPPKAAFNWNDPNATPAVPPPAVQTGPHGEQLSDDPSAPANTPLCGTQAREINAIGSAIDPEAAGAAGVCATYACYDPLTATYIGADGARHVCRLAS
ncbi:hypothetical protein FHR90_000135 [Endobacter medicaginis]|uniref:Lectin-like protein BA14k n=2 Tax=Endobacter medicaginis TaxID=1181271 RepID=A0A839UYF4_9PROT|nr:BA14K family protein [Endobacter medicaginis]MBB3172329.1 hypothetical protein [Endobacter medicaginis]MCX5474552.1 BA14K family protein [Endobacter medicaginis]